MLLHHANHIILISIILTANKICYEDCASRSRKAAVCIILY